jgi:hypothetical protein
MGVWNQTSDGAKDGKRLNFEMGRMLVDLVLVDGDIRIVLFVDIQILDDSSGQSIVKVHGTLSKGLEEARRDFGLTLLHHDQRPTYTAFVAGNMNSIVMVVNVDADELRYSAHSPELPEAVEELLGLSRQGAWRSVDEYYVCTVPVDFSTRHRSDILGSEYVHHFLHRSLIVSRCDVCHQRQVLDETTSFSLGCV